MSKSFKSLILALVLAILLTYMIMAAQFESLLHPFLVMFTLPMGAAGAIVALLLTGQTINVISIIGMVVLVGIVVDNAIVKIDYTNQLRRGGRGSGEAVDEGSHVRLRPILMSTVSTLFGLIPMALGLEAGAELMRPLAIVVIGGLTFSTFLTLILIPVIYEVGGRAEEEAMKSSSTAPWPRPWSFWPCSSWASIPFSTRRSSWPPRKSYPQGRHLTSWSGRSARDRPDPGHGAARGGLSPVKGVGKMTSTSQIGGPGSPWSSTPRRTWNSPPGPARGADQGPGAPAVRRPAGRPALCPRGFPRPALPELHGLGRLLASRSSASWSRTSSRSASARSGASPESGRRRLGARDPGRPRQGKAQGLQASSPSRSARPSAHRLGTYPTGPGPEGATRSILFKFADAIDSLKELGETVVAYSGDESHPGQGHGRGRSDLRRHLLHPPDQRPADGQPDRSKERGRTPSGSPATSSASSSEIKRSSRPTSSSRPSTTRARRSARTSTTSISWPG